MKSKTAESKSVENTNSELRSEELKDAMSGYASSDVPASESIEGSDAVTDDRFRDPMSGYFSADALESGAQCQRSGG